MRSILILRHGETTWNVEGRWQGWLDIELAEAGIIQAKARAAQLADSGVQFAAIISSDLSRAAQTAEFVSQSMGVPVTHHPGLRERHGGEFEGLDAVAIDAAWPGFRERWRNGLEDAPPGGESDATVAERIRDVLNGLDDIADGAVLLVTHGGVARVFGDLAGEKTRTVVPNVGGRWFVWDGEALRAGAHLEPLPDTNHTVPSIE